MKVLAMSGSPRTGGNSDVLCDTFIEGASEASLKRHVYKSCAH